jgi:hypothetical protein
MGILTGQTSSQALQGVEAVGMAPVRLEEFDPVVGQEMVEVHLLGDHRLALDPARGPVVPEDPEDDLVSRVGGFGPVDCDAVFGALLFEAFEELGQLQEGPPPHGVSPGAERL